ncbi:phenylacetate--CoA ligase family protein [Methanobacterium formicicum]|uniref:CapK related-protein n=1 Tax=Methanobacterium formicicum (strain DSM 3637 / PP1) TaxID=1204725 RepID=K2R5B1_METFP|nr:phenylacetate--CoA ligase family protein [Methanobacterium formicicum]EKF86372.1 CapK related-protein [Methanobacterium formicicum DSM 3637]
MVKTFIYKTLKNTLGNFSDNTYQEINNIKSQEDLITFRDKSLKNLILHSYNNVPYYKNIFNEISLSNGREVDLNKFNNLTILNKENIRNNEKKLISKDYNERKWRYNYSGGSTGEPIRFIQDYRYSEYASASNYYYYKNILNIEEPYVKKIIIWGSERDVFKGNIGLKSKMFNWITNTIILNSYKMSTEDMDKYIKKINSYKPDIIRGYSGSLYELCKHIQRKKTKIYSPKVLVGSAETLNSEMRKLIEETFGTKIFDFYGSREVSNLAGECKEGLMHILPPNLIEIVDKNNKPVSTSKTGKVIITNLFNYSMPLLRYQNGDMATLGPKKCKCGSVLPTLKKVDGRITEHFILEDGTVIAGEYFIHLIGLYCSQGSISQFQFIQRDYRDVQILVVTDLLNETAKKNIIEKIKLVMGQNCNIEWNCVLEIPKTPSGKFFYTKSLVSDC